MDHPPSSEFDIFVSYAHQGDAASRDAVTALVARLHEELKADFKRRFHRDLRIFFDKENILDFDHWQVRCHRALRSSRFFIVCLSRSYLRSDACRWEWEQWCRHELEHGLVGQGAASLWFVRLEDLDAPEDAGLLRRWKGDLLQRFHVECREWRLDDPGAFLDAAARAELAQLTEHVARKLRILVTEQARRGNLPWPNANFVGREPELNALRDALIERPALVPAGIHGVGGMGKTALALAFAQKETDAFPGGCWLLRCEGRDRLLSVFRTLVLDLDIDLTDEEKRDDAAAVRRVLAVLRERGPALFLLDNVDRPVLAAPEQLRFLEGQSWVRLLYTTRLAPSEFEVAGARIRPLDLDTLPEAQGIDLIRRYQPGRAFASPAHEAAAREIVRLLNGLTLAVETAAVYLGQSDVRLAEPRFAVDIREYAKNLAVDLERGGGEGAMSQLGEVIATIRPTLARLDAPTRTILQIAALLGADAVALPWLRAVAGRHHPELAAEAEIGQSDPWSQIVRSLIGMRLFQATSEPRIVSIHRILQRVLDAELRQDREELQGGIEALVRRREAELKMTARWDNARWELEPLDALAALWDETGHPDTVWLMSQVGSLWFGLAEWSSAEPMMRRMLAIQREKLGEDHPLFGTALNSLAGLLQETGRFGEAEPMMRRALAIEETVFGPDHPRTALRLNNLASLLLATERHGEAEPLMRRALAIDEAEQGSDHLDVARDLNNLAQLLQATNRLSEAETLMRRALEIYAARLEKNHPSIAAQISNLAGVLQKTGRLSEAEPMLRQALAIDEASYGTEHPSVARDLNNLAALLLELNRLLEAEPMMRRALSIDEARYGAHHPHVAGDFSNLGQLLRKANRREEAEPMFRRALAIDEASFGADHPDVANSLKNLAQLLVETDRSAEAEPLMRRSLAIDEANMGPDHPDLAIRLNNLAMLLKDLGRLEEAEPLMRRHVEIFLKSTRASGHPHPHLQQGAANYTALLEAMGKTEAEADLILEQVAQPLGFSWAPAKPQIDDDVSPKLRNVLEKIRQNPSHLQEIALGLQRDDPLLLQELLQWIERLKE
jgi:tetratricopeptide (TPR) repeat protein